MVNDVTTKSVYLCAAIEDSYGRSVCFVLKCKIKIFYSLIWEGLEEMFMVKYYPTPLCTGCLCI